MHTFTQARDAITVDWAAERGWWGVTRWEEELNGNEDGFDELLEFLALAGPLLNPQGLLSVGLGTGGAAALGLCNHSGVGTGTGAGECVSADHSTRTLAQRLASACAAGGLAATAVVGDGSLDGY